MDGDRARDDARVILLPPTRRDAAALEHLLHGAGIGVRTCATMAEVCREIGNGAGVVVVSEEAVTAAPDALIATIATQPVWSDLGTIVLSRSGVESPHLSQILKLAGNATVLERPVRITTLLSLVRSALRGRARQYEVRDRLAELVTAGQALRAGAAERAALLEREQIARAEAELASHIKDEFLATLSHELRTPLSAILGWSQVLTLRYPEEGDLAQGLRTIERNARAQTKIIEDLLDMSRIVSGKVRVDLQRTPIGPAVQAAVDTIRPAADAKGIALDVQLGAAGDIVRGDPNRLQQIFWNLLSNAVKFTPRDRCVSVVATRRDGDIDIAVIDTGEGISADFLPHVFDRFRQADASTTRQHGGLGLGLAIVKQLVELHGGSIRASSAGADQGATFTVTLPLASAVQEPVNPAERRPSMAVTPLSAAAGGEGIAGIKVLVVDDEPDSRALIRRLLEDRDATVTAAASAAQAMEILATMRPDVLVSDIGMPGEDGYSFIRRLRALDRAEGGEIPAIALTAYARAEDRAKAVRAGFQHHIAKPVEPAELVAMVARIARTSA